jgi:SAM-dependent methyltransferase
MSETTGTSERARVWDAAYERHDVEGVSWFEPEPRVSLALIDALGTGRDEPVIDVGGGASLLADHLLRRGWQDITVLDLSRTALDTARARLGDQASVNWLHDDLLTWHPPRRYGLWHDRAVFHFLVDPSQQRAYLDTLAKTLAPGGGIIVGTFAPGGPEHCSSLPVARYSTEALTTLLGPQFTVIETRREDHTTPTGTLQPFTWIAARLARPPAASDAPGARCRG